MSKDFWLSFKFQTKLALKRAENELRFAKTAPIEELCAWLQLSYEIETHHFELRRKDAETKVNTAKGLVSTELEFQFFLIFFVFCHIAAKS